MLPPRLTSVEAKGFKGEPARIGGRASAKAGITRLSKRDFKAIFFDLDGTLVDIHGPLYIAARNTLRDFGQEPELTRERYDLALATGELWLGIPDDKRPEYMKRAFAHFMAVIARNGRLELLPHVPEALAEIKRRGYATAVITSRPGDAQALAHKLAEAGIARLLDQIVTQTASSMKEMLDKTELLRQTAARAAVETRECIYVGDEPRDIMAADEAGYGASVAVATGTASVHYLQNHPNFRPDHVIESMGELIGLLDRIARRRS